MEYTVKNVSKGPRGIHSTTGIKLLDPREERDIDLSDAEYRGALSTGYFRITGGPAQEAVAAFEPSDEREAAIVESIRALGEDEYTKAGKPEVDAINDLLGDAYKHVTASERDAIWQKMQG